jgi:hypothetical protein
VVVILLIRDPARPASLIELSGSADLARTGDTADSAVTTFLAIIEAIAPGASDYVFDQLAQRRSISTTAIIGRARLTVIYTHASRELTVSLRGRLRTSIDPPAASEPRDPKAELVDVVRRAAGDGGVATGNLDRFWRDELPEQLESSVSYTPPSAIVPYAHGTIPSIACGIGPPSRWEDNAAYCGADSTISFDEDFLARVLADAGEIGPIAILAHEWGHHLQSLVGGAEYSLQRELQADCYAGMYLRSIFRSQEERDVRSMQEAARRFLEAGNDQYSHSAWFAEDEHGTGRMRTMAAGTGLIAGSGPFCLGYSRYEPGFFVDIGPYRLVLPPGMPSRDSNGRRLIQSPYATAAVVFLPIGHERRTAEDLLLASWRTVWGERIRATGGPHPLDVLFLLGDGSEAQYELLDEQLEPTEHGMMAMIVPPETDGALLIDVWGPGPAPLAASDERALEFERFAGLMYVLISRLCGPGNSASEADPGFNSACEVDL